MGPSLGPRDARGCFPCPAGCPLVPVSNSTLRTRSHRWIPSSGASMASGMARTDAAAAVPPPPRERMRDVDAPPRGIENKEKQTQADSPTRRPPCSTASPAKNGTRGRPEALHHKSGPRRARRARARSTTAARAPVRLRARQVRGAHLRGRALKLIRLRARLDDGSGTADQGRLGGPAGEVRPDAARELRAHAGAARALLLDARAGAWILRAGLAPGPLRPWRR